MRLNRNEINRLRAREAGGDRNFLKWWYGALGLTKAPSSGARAVMESDGGLSFNPGLTDRIRPEQVSTAALADILISPYPDEKRSAFGQCRPDQLADVLEAGDTTVTPSMFANVSTWNVAVQGLLEARILEKYQSPEFAMSAKVQHIDNAEVRQIKHIGISNIGDVAVNRDPGQPHARATLSERFTVTPVTVNRGIGIDVTREAGMFDRTSQLMTSCDSVTETLARRKEYLIVDVMIGIVNPYNYGGTSYNTYLTSGNWVNNIVNPINPATPQTVYQKLLNAWVNMVDPETGEPISISARDILVMPQNIGAAMQMLESEAIYATATAVGGTNWPAAIAQGKNPFKGMLELAVADKAYPYVFRRATAANGLALDATTAAGYWWAGDFKKAFCWHSNLPLTTVRASATDYVMGDRGLIFALFCDEMGAAGVLDPRYVTQCTPS